MDRLRNRSKVLMFLLALATQRASASAYDTAILADHPTLYLTMASPFGGGVETDLSGLGHAGHYLPNGSRPVKTQMPNGDRATVFNGTNEYLEVTSSPLFSVRKGGALTIEAWIRPDTLEFPFDEGDGYVHWAGKGESGEQEYACRIYSKTNTASPSRPNRISGYAFNPNGGLGSGSYFQDTVVSGVWIHVAVVINTRTRPGTVAIYKNGVLRDTTPLSQFHVVPQAGNAPLRVATRDLYSFFKGAMGKFALYAYPLTATQVVRHYQRMH